MTDPEPLQPGQPPLRLLIDACLTPAAIDRLTRIFDDRVDVTHVDRVLPPASSDAAVLAWATAQRRMVVTANGADFTAQAREGAGHPGLGLIKDQDTQARQIQAIERLTAAILDRMASGGDLKDNVFVLRTSGRLSIRRIPSTTALDQTAL